MSEWLTWQIVDSAFPTGLFAHSWGLESAWQHGEVDGPDAFRQFVDASILQAGYATLPFVNAAYQSAAMLERLDGIAEAFLSNQVVNRTSRSQGRTLLATAERVWPSTALEALRGRARNTLMHVAPVSGATFRAIGLPLATTQRLVLFATARGVLSAAVRLGIAGAYEAQQIQHATSPWLDEVAARCARLSIDDLTQPSPLIDLLQARHDRLYSRLFQS